MAEKGKGYNVKKISEDTPVQQPEEQKESRLRKLLRAAANGVILLLSLGMAAAYWLLIRRASRKMGVQS